MRDLRKVEEEAHWKVKTSNSEREMDENNNSSHVITDQPHPYNVDVVLVRWCFQKDPFDINICIFFISTCHLMLSNIQVT